MQTALLSPAPELLLLFFFYLLKKPPKSKTLREAGAYLQLWVSKLAVCLLSCCEDLCGMTKCEF